MSENLSRACCAGDASAPPSARQNSAKLIFRPSSRQKNARTTRRPLFRCFRSLISAVEAVSGKSPYTSSNRFCTSLASI